MSWAQENYIKDGGTSRGFVCDFITELLYLTFAS